MRTYEDIVSMLNEKIPRDVIAQREGGFGKKLNYLEGWYVIDRLNQVFLPGNWAFQSHTDKLWEGTIDTNKGPSHYVSYKATVKLVVTLDKIQTEFTDVGFGDGSDKNNPGKAHELALKEAVTDGLKRCARCLGGSFGNALYDKSGEGIEDQQQAPMAKQESPSVQKETTKTARSRETTNKLISQTSKVVIDKKLLTQDLVVSMLESYGVKTKDELTDDQANELLSKLQVLLK